MIELERFTEADCRRLIEWIPNAQFLLQWAGPNYSWPLNVEQIQHTLVMANVERPSHYMFKALISASQQTIGHIELMRVDRRLRTGHIGRVLVGPPELRGRGWGRQIVSRLINVAFDELELRELTLNVFSFNHAGIACYRSLGFRPLEFENGCSADQSNLRMKLDRTMWGRF